MSATMLPENAQPGAARRVLQAPVSDTERGRRMTSGVRDATRHIRHLGIRIGPSSSHSELALRFGPGQRALAIGLGVRPRNAHRTHAPNGDARRAPDAPLTGISLRARCRRFGPLQTGRDERAYRMPTRPFGRSSRRASALNNRAEYR